jgi:hypothetical protein
VNFTPFGPYRFPAWVRGEISAMFTALIERRSPHRKLTTIKSFKGHPDESGSNI